MQQIRPEPEAQLATSVLVGGVPRLGNREKQLETR